MRDPIQRTPGALYAALDAEFGFTLDAAASPANALARRFFTVEDDAFSRSWADEVVWLNPPFGNGLGEWLRKAWEESGAGATVVVLVPSATDLSWWHEYVVNADEVRFIRGRVRFWRESGRGNGNAFFPCSLVVFRPNPQRLARALPLGGAS